VLPFEFEDYWLPFLRGQGPAPAYVATLAPQARALLRAALERTLSPGLDGRMPPAGPGVGRSREGPGAPAVV
jgi:hypothetical protein